MKSTKPKLIQVVDSLAIGGVSMVVINQCNNLHNNYEISIICLNKDTSMLGRKKLDRSIKVYCYAYNYSDQYSAKNYISNLLKLDKLAVKADDVLSKIEEINPDIIHFHVNPMELIIGHVCQIRLPRTKLVYTDHLLRIDSTSYSFMNRLLLQWIFKWIYRPYNVISVSEQINYQHLKNRVLNSSKKHIVIENNVDLSEINIKHSDTGTTNVLYIARLSRVKGHGLLLKAWSKLQESNCMLWLVGSGELEEELKELAIDLNISESVKFVGNVIDIREFLSIADIGVFPSQKEGLPLSALEMMAVGLPVIASDIPELRHLISDPHNGLLFPQGNVNILTSKISLLINNLELRYRIGENARDFVKKNYNSQNNINHYLKFYESLTDEEYQ